MVLVWGFFLHTVAEPGLTQVFPVSTSKIQFFSRSRAAPWHQPSWMTQSTKAEHIPMVPLLHIHPCSPPGFAPTPFPAPSISIQPEPVAGAPQCLGDKKHGHVSAPSHVLAWPRSLLCAGLPSAQQHGLPYAPVWVVWASRSHGSRLLTWGWGFASPLRPLP